MLRSGIIIILSLSVLISFSGCQYLKKKITKTEKETITLSALNKTALSITNVSGKINVYKTNDTNNIIINAVKTGKVNVRDKDKPLENIRMEIDSSSDVIKVSTYTQSEKEFFSFSKEKSLRIDYDIYVGSNLEILIENTNGDIVLNSLTNPTTIAVVNGDTKLSNFSGQLKFESVNGKLKGNIDSTSGIVVDIVNGSVNLVLGEKVKGEIRANTTNGKIKYYDLNLKNISKEENSLTAILDTNSAIIQIDVLNGKITLSGRKSGNSKDENEDKEEVESLSEKYYSFRIAEINNNLFFK